MKLKLMKTITQLTAKLQLLTKVILMVQLKSMKKIILLTVQIKPLMKETLTVKFGVVKLSE